MQRLLRERSIERRHQRPYFWRARLKSDFHSMPLRRRAADRTDGGDPQRPFQLDVSLAVSLRDDARVCER